MPAANSIDELLERMVEANASDLHVTTGTPPAIRVRGEVERLEGFDALTGEETQQLLYRILSSEQQKHLELNRQLDFSYSIPGLARFRVNTYFQRESNENRTTASRSESPSTRWMIITTATTRGGTESRPRPAKRSANASSGNSWWQRSWSRR